MAPRRAKANAILREELASAYIYDWNNPSAGWQATMGGLVNARANLACTRVELDIGQVVVAVGGRYSPDIVPDTDVYNIATGQW